jgi:hypothetical protein
MTCPLCGGGGRARACPKCGAPSAGSGRPSVAETVRNMVEVATDEVRQAEALAAVPLGLPSFREEMQHRTAAMLEAAEAEDWGRFMLLCSNNQRTDVLSRVAEKIHDDELYWRLISFVWHQEGHFYHLHPREWGTLLSAQRPGSEHLMTPAERHALAHLPAELTVWRGTRSVEDSGWSWSLDRGVAELFARQHYSIAVTPGGLRRHRLGDEAALWRALVQRADVLAYFIQDGEFEVLVDPARVGPRELVPFRLSAPSTPPAAGPRLLQGDIAALVRLKGAAASPWFNRQP